MSLLSRVREAADTTVIISSRLRGTEHVTGSCRNSRKKEDWMTWTSTYVRYAVNMQEGERMRGGGKERQTDQTCCEGKEVEKDLQHVPLDQYISVL